MVEEAATRCPARWRTARPSTRPGQARVGVRRLGVLVLRREVAAAVVEQAEIARPALAVLQRVPVRLGNRVPDRLLGAPLVAVDPARRGGAVLLLAEAVPVVGVHDPARRVDVAVAVGRLQLAVERIRADRGRGAERDRVVARGRLLRPVRRGRRRIVATATGLVGVVGNHVLLHVGPRVVERGPVTGDPTVVGGQPQPVAVGLRGGLVAVVRRLHDGVPRPSGTGCPSG